MLLTVSVLAMGAAAGAVAPHKGVTPGTPSQVAKAVAVSNRSTRLTQAEVKQLSLGYNDFPTTTYPSTNRCEGSSKGCAFGDTHAARVVVLFGDSHALMWLPAIAPAASRAKVKLLLFWHNSCPVAAVGNYSLQGKSVGTPADCRAFRGAALRTIQRLHPYAVILSERTTLIYSEPQHRLFTKGQWQSALESPIKMLKKDTSHVVLMQDLTWFNTDPHFCLGGYPTQVQRCAQSNPNRVNPGEQSAEAAAAKVMGIRYVATRQWFCTKSCSPLVSGYVTYVDRGHVCATYATYLSLVVGDALRPDL